jgi:hypothetical protein
MAEHADTVPRHSAALTPTRAASLATLVSAAAAIVGVAGQLVEHGSVGFAMLAGFGLVALAAIVFAHQQ